MPSLILSLYGFWSAVFLFCLGLTPSLSFAAAFPSCECPKLECEPCYQEQGVSFYSEKCGEDGARVRSCARPTCELMDPLPNGCEQARKQKSEPRTPASQLAPAAASAAVSLPPVEAAAVRGPQVAEVHHISGQVWYQALGNEKQLLKKGSKLHEKDWVATGAKSTVVLKFFDGNEVKLTENSELRLETYENNMSDKKRAILNLIKGRVRSRVQQKYDGETSYFRIKTKSAVAGVRGTDFVVSFSEKERWVTDVATFEGKVQFAGGSEPDDEALSIGAGEQASFVVAAAPSSDVFSDEEIQAFVAKGYMTPVYKMTAEDLERLEEETNWKGEGRAVASPKEARTDKICSHPEGRFNQCLWTCENNPAGSDRCRTDLPQVHCVRKRCNAAGNWADESRLPASFYEACEPQGARVGPCDY